MAGELFDTAKPSMSLPMPARFEGDCDGCLYLIRPGDQIRMIDGVAWHDDCVAEASSPFPRAEPSPCPRCHLIPAITGVCDCD